MYNMGGEYWKSWKASLTRMLKDSQEPEPPLKGTWTPVGDFLGTYAGRLYVTAFNVLNLEVDYRYLPLYKKKKPEKKKTDKPKRLATKDELLQILNDSKFSRKIRNRAVEDLAKRFARDEKILRLLARSLMNPSLSTKAKSAAFMALKRAGGKAVPYLEKVAYQVDEMWAQRIIVIFRDQKDPASERVLEVLSRTADSNVVRKAAAEALKSVRGK
jgi:hypothetical protein